MASPSPVSQGYAFPQAGRPGDLRSSCLGTCGSLILAQRLAAARRASLSPSSVKPSWTSAPVNPIGPPPVSHPNPPPNRRSTPVKPYSYWRSAYLVQGLLAYGQLGYGDTAEAAYASGDSPVYGEEPQDAFYEGAPPDPSLDYADQPTYPTQARSPYERETARAAIVSGRPVVTLFYKDGRPEERIQNYALTRTTLFVQDAHSSREVPLDELDLPRTEQANRDAGVDFDLPSPAE